MVVFVAQLEIVEQQGDFRTSDDQNTKYQEKESENVVVIVHPYRSQDEIELDKASSKRQNSADHESEWCAHEPRLVWDLSRNARGLHWKFNCILLVPIVSTQKDQWS